MQPGPREDRPVVVGQVDPHLRADERGVTESEQHRIRRLTHSERHLIGSAQRGVELDAAHQLRVGRARCQRPGVGAGGECLQARTVLAETIAHIERCEGGELAESAHSEPHEEAGDLLVAQHLHGVRRQELP